MWGAESIRACGIYIERKTLSIKTQSLSGNITVLDLIKGGWEIPADVSQFLRKVICNNDPRTVNSCNCTCKVNSIVQDLIYAVSHGKIKTSKHLTLGMTLKSITTSRKVIDIINKYGHCFSYNTIEEYKTYCKWTSRRKETNIFGPYLMVDRTHTRSSSLGVTAMMLKRNQTSSLDLFRAPEGILRIGN